MLLPIPRAPQSIEVCEQFFGSLVKVFGFFGEPEIENLNIAAPI